MAYSLFMGGIFNIVDPVLQWPLYVWSWILLVIFSLVAWAIMYFRKWKPLAPLHGLYYAQKFISTVAFIFDEYLVGELVAERDAKCIFDYSDHNYLTGDAYEIDVPNIPIVKPILTWLYVKLFYYPTVYLDDISKSQAIVYKIGKVNKDVEIARKLEGGTWERSAAVVCAGVPVDIVVDMDKWTIRGSKQHKAVVRLAEEWNHNNPNDQIHSYQKFQKYLDAKLIPDSPDLRSGSVIPWQRIDAAFPLDLDKNEWAGKVRQMAKDQEEAEQIQLNKFALWVFLGGIGLAVLIIAARFAIVMVAYSKVT